MSIHIRAVDPANKIDDYHICRFDGTVGQAKLLDDILAAYGQLCGQYLRQGAMFLDSYATRRERLIHAAAVLMLAAENTPEGGPLTTGGLSKAIKAGELSPNEARQHAKYVLMGFRPESNSGKLATHVLAVTPVAAGEIEAMRIVAEELHVPRPDHRPDHRTAEMVTGQTSDGFLSTNEETGARLSISFTPGKGIRHNPHRARRLFEALAQCLGIDSRNSLAQRELRMEATYIAEREHATRKPYLWPVAEPLPKQFEGKSFDLPTEPNDSGFDTWACVRCGSFNSAIRQRCRVCKDDRQMQIGVSYCVRTDQAAAASRKPVDPVRAAFDKWQLAKADVVTAHSAVGKKENDLKEAARQLAALVLPAKPRSGEGVNVWIGEWLVNVRYYTDESVVTAEKRERGGS